MSALYGELTAPNSKYTCMFALCRGWMRGSLNSSAPWQQKEHCPLTCWIPVPSPHLTSKQLEDKLLYKRMKNKKLFHTKIRDLLFGKVVEKMWLLVGTESWTQENGGSPLPSPVSGVYTLLSFPVLRIQPWDGNVIEIIWTGYVKEPRGLYINFRIWQLGPGIYLFCGWPTRASQVSSLAY